MGTFSAVTMGLAVLLAIIFAGVQDHPFGFIVGEDPIVTVIPAKGTTYVAGAFSSYYWSGILDLASIFVLTRHVGVLEHNVYSGWPNHVTVGW